MGVKKTYRKLYWKNVGKALNLLYDIEDGVEKVKEFGKEILEKEGLYPVMDNDNGYQEREKEFLKTLIDEDSEVEKSTKSRSQVCKAGNRKRNISGYGSIRA